MPPLNESNQTIIHSSQSIDEKDRLISMNKSTAKEHTSTSANASTEASTSTTSPTSTSTLRNRISRLKTNVPKPKLPTLNVNVPSVSLPLNPVRRVRRSRSAPAGIGRRRHRLVEQHYNMDQENMTLLPGVPKHDEDLARDVHDYFNLMALVPLVVLDVLNWDWDKMDVFSMKSVISCWNGDYYHLFWYATLAYFIVDLAWVLIIPRCVKSPSTIIQHHVATILYLSFPHYVPDKRWCMGVLMSVEVNTWFLIARRVFNKQGFPPWTIDLPYLFSVRVKLISIFFYITWIVTRCVIYPAMGVVFWNLCRESRNGGSGGTKEETVDTYMWVGIFTLHMVFCLLNMKWTWDLANSKIRQWKSKGKKNTKIASGL